MFYISPFYMVIFFATLIISGAAQLFLKSQYSKWGKVQNGAGLTGAEVGYRLLNETSLRDFGGKMNGPSPDLKRLDDLRSRGLINDNEYRAKKRQLEQGRSYSTSGVRLERIGGHLTDHYDPREQVVRMSEAVADKRTVAAMAIVAHELGHAQQHQVGSLLITMRNVLVPAVRFSPQLAYFMIFLGLIFNFAGLIWLGVLFYGLMVVFSILTLPVEIDASRRGLKLLNEVGLMQTAEDKQGSRRVLTAAASTYIAAAVTAILQLLYYMSLARRR